MTDATVIDKAKPSPKAPAPAAAPVPLPACAPLQADQMNAEEYLRGRHMVRPAPGVKPEQILRPEYWAHVAAKLKSGDVIAVLAQDMTWEAEVLVWNTGKGFAHVDFRPGSPHMRPATFAIMSRRDDFLVEFINGPTKWRVVRRDDSNQMVGGLETEQAANEWIIEHLRPKAA